MGGGVCQLKNDRSKRYLSLETDKRTLSNPNPTCLYLDNDQDLWVGVYDKGLNRQMGTFEHYPLLTSPAALQDWREEC